MCTREYVRDKQALRMLCHPQTHGQADDQIHDQQQQIRQPSSRQENEASVTIPTINSPFQTTYIMQMSKPQQAPAQHMFRTECITCVFVCAMYQHSCLLLRIHLFQVIFSLLGLIIQHHYS